MRTQAAADPAATRRPVVEPQPSYLTGGSKKVVSLYLTFCGRTIYVETDETASPPSSSRSRPASMRSR